MHIHVGLFVDVLLHLSEWPSDCLQTKIIQPDSTAQTLQIEKWQASTNPHSDPFKLELEIVERKRNSFYCIFQFIL